MKGFLLLICIFIVLVTFAYALKRKITKPDKKVKTRKDKIDIPFKDLIIKIKKK